MSLLGISLMCNYPGLNNVNQNICNLYTVDKQRRVYVQKMSLPEQICKKSGSNALKRFLFSFKYLF